MSGERKVWEWQGAVWSGDPQLAQEAAPQRAHGYGPAAARQTVRGVRASRWQAQYVKKGEPGRPGHEHKVDPYGHEVRGRLDRL